MTLSFSKVIIYVVNLTPYRNHQAKSFILLYNLPMFGNEFFYNFDPMCHKDPGPGVF